MIELRFPPLAWLQASDRRVTANEVGRYRKNTITCKRAKSNERRSQGAVSSHRGAEYLNQKLCN